MNSAATGKNWCYANSLDFLQLQEQEEIHLSYKELIYHTLDTKLGIQISLQNSECPQNEIVRLTFRIAGSQKKIEKISLNLRDSLISIFPHTIQIDEESMNLRINIFCKPNNIIWFQSDSSHDIIRFKKMISLEKITYSKNLTDSISQVDSKIQSQNSLDQPQKRLLLINEINQDSFNQDIDEIYKFLFMRSNRSKFRILSNDDDDLECNGGYEYKNKCYCNEGKFPRYQKKYEYKCESCGSYCKECATQSTCETCYDGYYNNKGTCYKCESSCKTCSDSSRCLTCSSPLYLTPSSKCQECNLNLKQYIDKDVCKNCDNSCQSCQDSSANKCTKCATGYQKAPQTSTSTTFSCLLCEIQNGYYIKGTECKPCDASCLTCDGSLNTNCNTCKGGKVLNEQSICVDCSKTPGSFLKSNICQKCDSNCASCTDNSTKCTSCSGILSLKDTTCVDCSTQQGFYKSSDNKCLKCHASCLSCSAYSTCTACANGYFWDEQRKNCIQCDTNNGFFQKGDECLRCHEYCLKCNSKDNNQASCSSCKANYDFIQIKGQPEGNKECGICDQSLGFYKDTGTCKKCQSNCARCSLDAGILKCLQCEDKYFFDGDSQTTCIICSSNQYIDVNRCRNCHLSCQKCFNGSDLGCEVCATTYLRLESEKKCVKCDQPGQVIISSDKCAKCSGNCNSCETNNLEKCITCLATFHLFDNGKCDTCSGNYYTDGINCKPCDQSCNGCNPTTLQCLACAAGYTKDSASTPFNCIKCHEYGYFQQGDLCSKCHSTCYKCDGPNSDHCISCYEGDTQTRGICNASCTAGSGESRCPCDTSCKTCRDQPVGTLEKKVACTSCDPGKFLKQSLVHGSPYFSCDDCTPTSGYYQNEVHCLPCTQSNCKQCKGGGTNDCTLCDTDNGFYLNENNECAACDVGSQKTLYQSRCYQCPPDCDECEYDNTQSKVVCKKCVDPKKLDIDKNCITCPDEKYYKDGDSCIPCYPSCLTCGGGQLERNCLTCQNNLFFIEEKCQTCPSLNYVLTDKCYRCDSSCLKCSGTDTKDCTQCKPGSYFIEEGGQKYCKSCDLSQGYYIENQQNCKKCHTNCNECYGPGSDECTSCKPNYALFEGRKCDVCDTANQKYIVPVTQICADCDSSCQTCNGGTDLDCSSCINSFYKYDNLKCGECNEAIENMKRDDKKCVKCHNTCAEGCDSISKTDCKKCKSGLFFKINSDGDRVCETCPTIGFYISNEDCLKCDDTCNTCEGTTELECIDCKTGLSFMNDDTCQACPKDFYFVNSDNECLECSLHCKSCSNFSTCDACDDGYQLDIETHQCVICSQKSGYYIQNSICLKCHSACHECNGGTDFDCIDCQTDYSKINSSQQCIYCPSDKDYVNNFNNCLVCEDVCSLCGLGSQLPFEIRDNTTTNNKYCKECKCKVCAKGFVMFEGICKSRCNEIGEFFTLDKTFSKCVCLDSHPYQIYEVFSERKKKYCSSIIPNGFFCTQDKKCQECQRNCSKCKDSTQCSYCDSNHFLWEGKCHKTCPNYTDLVENKEQRLCECPEKHNYKIPRNLNHGICIKPLTLVQVNVFNSFMSQSDEYYIDKEKNIQKSYNNFIKFTFNREPLEEEIEDFDFKINENQLVPNKDYTIVSIQHIDNEIILEVLVKENRRVQSFSYTVNGLSEKITLKNAILTTEKYNKSQEGGKNTVTNLKSLSSVVAPQNGKSKEVIDFLKKFQFLCFLSNFVQVLGSITLLKDSIPPQVYIGAEMGASFIFSSIPEPDEVGFSPEMSKSSELTQEQLKYEEEDTLQAPYSILIGLGLEGYLFSNFMVLHLILDISSLLILVLLIARKTHAEKQYSLRIVDKIANQMVSYSQGSITATFFCITFSLSHPEYRGLAIFQISVVCLLFLEILYLVISRSDIYLTENIPNFFENINFKLVGSRSYIVVQFLKKYFVITIVLVLCSKPIACTTIVCIAFFLQGIYILRYRFFKTKIINIFKIFQEFLIALLFIILVIAIHRYSKILSKDIISDDELDKIELLSFIVLVFFIFCLSVSLLIFLIKLMVSLYDLFNFLKSKLKKDEQQLKVIECENLSSISQLNNSYSLNIRNRFLKSLNSLQDAKSFKYERKPNRSPTSTEGDI